MQDDTQWTATGGLQGHVAEGRPVAAAQPIPPSGSAWPLEQQGASLLQVQASGHWGGQRAEAGVPPGTLEGAVRMGQGEPARTKDENFS